MPDDIVTTDAGQDIVTTSEGKLKIVETQTDKWISFIKAAVIAIGASLFPMVYTAWETGQLTFDKAGLYVLGALIFTAVKKWMIDVYK